METRVIVKDGEDEKHRYDGAIPVVSGSGQLEVSGGPDLGEPDYFNPPGDDAGPFYQWFRFEIRE